MCLYISLRVRLMNEHVNLGFCAGARRDRIIGSSPSITESIDGDPLRGGYHRGHGLNDDLRKLWDSLQTIPRID